MTIFDAVLSQKLIDLLKNNGIYEIKGKELTKCTIFELRD